MKKQHETNRPASETTSLEPSSPLRVRLPGFLLEEGAEIGLGDVVRRATSSVGMRSCDGCRRRAAAMNRRLVFTGRRNRS